MKDTFPHATTCSKLSRVKQGGGEEMKEVGFAPTNALFVLLPRMAHRNKLLAEMQAHVKLSAFGTIY